MLWETIHLAASALLAASTPATPAAVAAPALSLQTVQRTPRFVEGDRLKKRGDQLLNAGRAAEAIPFYRRAVDLFLAEFGERHPITVSTQSNYASALANAGRPKEAAPIYESVYRIRRAKFGDRDINTIKSLNNYAYIVNALGRTGEAETLYAALIDDARAVLGDRHPLTLGALNNYATALSDLGRDEEALPIAREVLRLYETTLGERDRRTLTAMNNVGTKLLGLQRFEEAAPILERAQRLTRLALGPTHPDTLGSQGNYAFVLVKLGRLSEGAALHESEWRDRRRTLGPLHPSTLLSQSNYASVLSQLGRNREGEELMADAVKGYTQLLGRSHPRTIDTLANHVTFLIANRRDDAALSRSREVVRALRGRAFKLAEGSLRDARQGEREQARDRVTERQHADAIWPSYARAKSPVDLKLGEEAFVALERATAGTASRAVIQAAAARFANQSGLSALVNERQELERAWRLIEAALIANQKDGSQGSEERGRLQRQLTRLEDRVAQIDARLAREAPQFFAMLKQREVSFDQLISILDDDEAVLFLVPSRFGTHVMTLSKDTFQWERSTIREDEVVEAVDELRQGLEIAAGEEYLPFFDLELAHTLYQQLFAPVEASLVRKKRVYVVADGALSRLPLGTLVRSPPGPDANPDDPDVLRGVDWLADRFALVQLPSVQSLVYLRLYGSQASGGGGADRFLGFGAPVLQGAGSARSARSATLAPIEAASFAGRTRGAFGAPLMDPQALRQLSALPGTRTELETVRSALGAPESSLFLDTRMTESAIRSADLSRTRILHLATHGFTSEESGETAEPGLVFTPPVEARPQDDGYLAASEVVGLNLALAQWVILSACNTASPSGRPGESGLSGLAQAFFFAGAQSLLVSHWPVFDDIAPVLTVEALKRVEAGQPRAEALQAAIRQIREDPALEAAHPAVWAPFTLVGEGR